MSQPKSRVDSLESLLRTASEAPSSIRVAARWEKMPKGWTDESRKKFWETLTGGVKHKVTRCMEKMEGKFDDTGAFCGALADRVDPGWREKVWAEKRKKKEQDKKDDTTGGKSKKGGEDPGNVDLYLASDRKWYVTDASGQDWGPFSKGSAWSFIRRKYGDNPRMKPLKDWVRINDAGASEAPSWVRSPPKPIRRRWACGDGECKCGGGCGCGGGSPLSLQPDYGREEAADAGSTMPTSTSVAARFLEARTQAGDEALYEHMYERGTSRFVVEKIEPSSIDGRDVYWVRIYDPKKGKYPKLFPVSPRRWSKFLLALSEKDGDPTMYMPGNRAASGWPRLGDRVSYTDAFGKETEGRLVWFGNMNMRTFEAGDGPMVWQVLDDKKKETLLYEEPSKVGSRTAAASGTILRFTKSGMFKASDGGPYQRFGPGDLVVVKASDGKQANFAGISSVSAYESVGSSTQSYVASVLALQNLTEPV